MDGRRDPPVYPGAIPILRALQSKGVRLAVASKSPATAQAKMFLRRLQIVEMFESIQASLEGRVGAEGGWEWRVASGLRVLAFPA